MDNAKQFTCNQKLSPNKQYEKGKILLKAKQQASMNKFIC